MPSLKDPLWHMNPSNKKLPFTYHEYILLFNSYNALKLIKINPLTSPGEGVTVFTSP